MKTDNSTKRVILVRHSKTEEQANLLSDYERSLTFSGKEISHTMARKLLGDTDSLGLIITSPAFRAVETALIFAEEYNTTADEIRLCPELYHSVSTAEILEIIASLDDSVSVVTLFGHNPLISETASLLSSGTAEFIPKTGVVIIDFNCSSWEAIPATGGQLVKFLKPKAS